MFSGLAAAIGVGTGSLVTTGGVLGGVLGTEQLRAGGHEIEYVAVGVSASATDVIKYGEKLNDLKDISSAGNTFPQTAETVAYGKDIWVAGGIGSTEENCVLWSTDRRYWHNTIGTNFTRASAGEGCRTVVYGSTGGDDRKGLWLAGGTCFTANDTIYWSDDGKNWLDVPGFGVGVGFGETCEVIAWGGSETKRFIAGGTSAQGYTTKLMYSDNGLTPPGQTGGWTNCNIPTEFYNAKAIAYGGGIWLAGGSGESGPEYTLISSIDNGEHWTQGITVPFSGNCLTIAYGGNGVWVVSGETATGGTDTNEDRLSYLTDAGDFTVNNTFQAADSIQDPPGITSYNLYIFSVIYTGKEFVASGQIVYVDGGTSKLKGIIYVSSDGKNWKFKDRNVNFTQINQIAYKP